MRRFRSLAGFALAVAPAAAATGLLAPAPRPDAPVLLLAVALGTLAAACAAIASTSSRGGPLRLGLVFVLASMEILSPHATLWVAVAALAAGRGGGLAGPPRRDAIAFASSTVGVAAAALLTLFLRRLAVPGSAVELLRLAAAFVVVQLPALGLDAFLRRRLEPGPGGAARPTAARLALEAAAVPIAWLLAFLTESGRFALAAAFAGCVLLGQIALRRLDRALADLRATNDALAARLAELASLHAIGREMLSSLNPVKVLAVVERECRKILDVEDLRVSLVDPDTGSLRVEHRWLSGQIPAPGRDVPDDDLAVSVFLDRRPLRSGLPGNGSPAPGGSFLAVPLVVEDRVTGVVSVRTSRRAAYDENHERVLTTIAQQAAVAIENARRHELATVDSLTRLLDRDYFQHCLEAEYNRARRYGGSFAVLMMDLDDFKSINDRHGHLAGDRYLRELGAAIRGRMRSADLACRYGGDEFCILLPETDAAGARAIAGRIRRAVARLVVELDGAALHTTASIGIAVFPQHDAGALRALVGRADQALYRAKREGRDHVSVFEG